ncbi:serine hydrolase [Bradyrhizobium sp. U87765 SZCCT0131]|uniref:serine hydrolase domain-containing protein n=1 Tax=unclassified Bradyrhizobium TaxID=2631580 RepID=UPI001BACC3D6|nr:MULTISPECIES: serine hydrolase [unclassified Bradyrhizobium]MBR1222967.1 serine hydrolase [Bradyrhizobium sp. U87765 SZCCT0131]MBR1262703.1 serine hydrolase [Bradyrhizobium sp. U87765 SZCCT0134]MBR1308825.1 serine hydrolase [Bradyrhizobium sp. U87765 SZCCT0110]MBR1318485.1 serine hydrolase [Bradyrhizobium sp. U87765 SZCCT0109]MBR1352189.1 serine hydrolase [Bradyrhizobium sp. U87765 SZCCT0048]
MTSVRLMDDFPPPSERLVTLANWRTFPYTQWSFRNVRQLLPTAPIAASGNATPLPADPRDIGGLAFAAPSGSETTLDAALRQTSTDALLVMRRGQLMTEWYANGMDAERLHIVFSVSKSICGSLGGILVDRGIIDPDRPVIDIVPELKNASAYATATLRHVLDMTVGISFVEDYLDPDGDVARYRRAMGWDPVPPGQPVTDLRSFLAGQKADGKAHGEAFHYVSTNTDVLGWLYERATRRPLAELISEHLWKPLGAEREACITVDAHGAMRAAGGICAAPRDLLRFAEMMHRRGVAAGRQVVPGWWVDDINTKGDPQAWNRGDFAPMFPGGRYRSQWYQLDHARRTLCAIGIHGQWIYIDPPSETVIVRMASEAIPLDPDSAGLWMRAFAAIARLP